MVMHILPLGALWIPVLILFVLQESYKESKILRIAYFGSAASYALFVFFYILGV